MVLSYSRRVFLRFFLDARIDAFLTGHVLAFAAFGAVPRVILYDNLKSAVLERQGDAIRFNPTLLAFAARYRFEPRPVGVARGNERDAWSGPFATSATISSPRAPSRTSTISTLRLRFGATGQPPIGPVPARP
jgi:hypothetical protein